MINALVPDIRSKGLSKEIPGCDPTQRHGAGGPARLPRPAAAGPRQHRRQGAQRT